MCGFRACFFCLSAKSASSTWNRELKHLPPEKHQQTLPHQEICVVCGQGTQTLTEKISVCAAATQLWWHCLAGPGRAAFDPALSTTEDQVKENKLI